MKFMWTGMSVPVDDDFSAIGTSPADIYYVAGQAGATALVTASPVANTLYAMPFRAPRRGGVLDRVGVIVIANLTDGTPSDLRLGVYEATSQTNPQPGVKLSDSGKLDGIDGTTPAWQTYNPSLSLRPGWLYWLAVCFDAVEANMIRGLSVNACRAIGLDAASPSATTSIVGWSAAGQPDITANALADPFPTATAIVAVPVPALGYHFSA